ncbi:hypothetical protein KKH03_00015 [Patescibacteria group bacterium]|nr:hypothetical protein [Patescibacteria group bacterium]
MTEKTPNRPTPPAAAQETPDQQALGKDLGLDELSDAQKKREVITFFEGKKDAIKGVASGKLEQLKAAMKQMERKQASSDQIITQILTTLFSTHLDENIRTKYADEFAQAVLAESIWLVGDDDTKEKLNSNSVFTKARAMVLGTIKAGIKESQESGKYLKPQYIDQYATAVFGKYVKNMDEDITGRVTEENVEKDLKPMTFNDWRASHPELTEKELYLDLSDTEARDFALDIAGIRKEMDKINPSLEGLDPKLSSYFVNEKSKLHEESLNRPDSLRLVQEEAVKLAASFAAAAALTEVQKGVREKLNEVVGLKDKVPNLDASLETGYKQVLTSIDGAVTNFIEKKNAESLRIDTKAKTDLDAKLEAEKQKAPAPGETPEGGEAGAEGAEAEEKINPLEDPAGFLQNMFKDHPIIASMLSMFGLDKIFDKVMQNPTVRRLRDMATYAGKSKEQIEKIEKELIPKFVKFADEKFGIKKNGAEVLAKMKVPAVLKLTRSPIHVDEDQFTAFKAALELNGATKDTKGLVIDFMENKFDDWKAAPATEAAPATAAAAPAASPAAPTAAPTPPPSGGAA